MVITIGGKYGTGGKVVAKKLAELLGYRLCNDEIIIEAVKNCEYDMKEETFRYFDESQGEGSLAEMEKISGIQRNSSIVKELTYDVVPLDRAMAEVQESVLNGLADKGNCILLGRCADHFLAGRDDVLSVLILDDDENCLSRIMEAYPELTEKEAKKLIKKTDRRREEYYTFFTNKRWCDAANYAMVLNCPLLGGPESAAEYLAGAVRAKEQQ